MSDCNVVTNNKEFTEEILKEFYVKFWEEYRKLNYDSRVDLHILMGHIIAEMTQRDGSDLDERARKVVEEINMLTCPLGQDIYGYCYEECLNNENYVCKLSNEN